MSSFTLRICQINPQVSNLEKNGETIRNQLAEATRENLEPFEKSRKTRIDLLVFPEMVLTGYPPDDLLLRADFHARIATQLERTAEATRAGGPWLLVSAPSPLTPNAAGLPLEREPRCYNSVFLLGDGKIQGRRDKVHLPGQGLFDELRHFKPGGMPGPFSVRGVRIGIPICEDAWFSDVVECLEESGAELIIVINASPYDRYKRDDRQQQAIARVTESGLSLVYVNLVGGQDEWVFDGGSFALDPARRLVARLPDFEECTQDLTFYLHQKIWQPQVPNVPKAAATTGELTTTHSGAHSVSLHPPLSHHEGLWQALVLSVRDYVRKSGFERVVLGLSGGVDSAIVAVIATDALGPDQVSAIILPSPYSSEASAQDAQALADRLFIKTRTLPIGDLMLCADSTLLPGLGGPPDGLAAENLQARLRGLLLMTLANQENRLLLTTGNKSEYGVGYATLYGDMCGAYAPIKDLFKTDLYDLARWHTQEHDMIPESILTKAPSAELRLNQKDSDSLPPYERLDPILRALVEEDASPVDLIEAGHSPQEVAQVARLLSSSEYKRRQAAPGPKLGRRAFGRERRYPIASGPWFAQSEHTGTTA